MSTVPIELAHANLQPVFEPRPFRVTRTRAETSDTVTFGIAPVDGEPTVFDAGQFHMLYAFGVGEVPISIAGRARDGSILHTVRAVGAVSKALCRLREGDVVGVRGPFGRGWPEPSSTDTDILFVAGGIGLAPLRHAIVQELQTRGRRRWAHIIYGARTPSDLLYRRELGVWGRRERTRVSVTVDRADPKWKGNVGVVTTAIARTKFNASRAIAVVCGPEIMIRFAAHALSRAGIPPERQFVSLERNMQCGVGTCGHCQLGPLLLCKDGPVVPYSVAERWLRIAEI